MTNDEITKRLNDLAYGLSLMECEKKRLIRENEQLRQELAAKDAYILKLKRFIRLKLSQDQAK
jgi:hypothetical protein